MHTHLKQFDTSALHQLRPEVSSVTQQLERMLSQYADDLESVAELADAQQISAQLAKVMKLIELKGADLLLEEVTQGLKELEDAAPQPMPQLVLALSLAMMLFSRYMDFVLLKKIQMPCLLLGSINQIRRSSGRSLLPIDQMVDIKVDVEDTLIKWPTSQIKGLKNSVAALINPYTPKDKKQRAWEYLGQVSQRINEHRSSDFFKGLSTLSTKLKDKPLLLFVQQFLSALEELPRSSAEDKTRLQHNLSALLEMLASETGESSFYDQWVRHDYFIYGPDRDAISTINQLIQTELSELKSDIDQLAHSDSFDTLQHRDCSIRMRSIALRLYVMGLSKAAHAVMEQAKSLANWKQLGEADQYNELMNSLLISENAAAMMAIDHTPGAMKPPLNNTQISIHKLSVAYDQLIDESRASLARTQDAIVAYAGSATKTTDMIASLPEELRSVSGALLFLEVPNGNKLMTHIARYLASVIQHAQELNDEQLERIADIVSSVDYFLDSLKSGRPTGQKPLVRGAQSLKALLAA